MAINRRFTERTARAVAAALVVGLGLALISCGHQTDHPRTNLRPHVRLTGGPIQGDSASYSSEFFWTGWDQDGIIDHYQYAIDIPSEFTPEDINNPSDVGIAWTDTTAFRARLLFTTPEQDTIQNLDGTLTLPRRYKGNHTFYVRAVDNEGAVSDADFLSFTARTIIPKTTVTLPNLKVIGSNPLSIGSQFNATWSSIDPDNPDPSKKPAYFEWKLVQVPGISQVNDANYTVGVSPGPNFPWNRVGVDTTSVRIPLDLNHYYVFAVRAVDEAGGVESKYEWGQNAVKIQSSSVFIGTPKLTVTNRTLGSAVFPGVSITYEIPVNQCFRFDFSANADAYGGQLNGYNYGLNVPDTEQEGPTSGFRGWSDIAYTDQLCFSTPGTNTLTIKVRDTGGGVTVGTIILKVIGFPQDKDVLYVDDYFDRIRGADGIQDNYHQTMLRKAGILNVDQYDVFEAGDVTTSPRLIRLSDVSRYKLLVWSVFGSKGTPAGAVGLVSAADCGQGGRVLQSFISAGGGAMIFGEQVFEALRHSGAATGTCGANLRADEGQGLSFNPGDFAYDFLHFQDSDIRTVKNTATSNGFIRVTPTPKATAAGFPPMEVDSALYDVGYLGGIPFVNAMFGATNVAGLDTMYKAVTIKPGVAFDKKPTGFRIADTNPVPSQGPVLLYGFPLHVMKTGSAEAGTGVWGMMRSAACWFTRNGLNIEMNPACSPAQASAARDQ